MPTYISEVASEKKFQGNVVIKINGNYFCIRAPDSGLRVANPLDRCVQSLLLNPTTLDIRKVTTTIASYSFRLVDKYGAISALVLGDASSLLNQEVEIWLGRSGVGMDFSDYYQLPTTRIKKVEHADNSYNFSSTEETERMARSIYDTKAKLAGDILADTTTLTMSDSIDDFPSTGMLKIDSEFMSYTGKDNTAKQFTGVVRGELNSTAATHDEGTDAVHCESVTANPIDIILQILTSGGGGGAYDVLQDGLGISSSLIDLTEIEELRDNLFADAEFELVLEDIDSALKFIESELLMPNNLRFTYSATSKLSLAILDRAVFVDDVDVIDEDTITTYPKWAVDQDRIANVLEVQWDYNPATNQYGKRTVAEEADSISAYGRRTPLRYSFKGIKSDLDGENLVSDFTTGMLGRLANPTPEVSFNTHIDKSLQNIGDKTRVESTQIPASDGSLAFASEMEIVSRSINFQTGDVQFKLAFTSFTSIRSGYIAPSDTIQTVTNQKTVTVPAGRGSYYQAGWKMRLWEEGVGYTADAVNEIASVSSDTITFVDNFTTVLTGPDDFRLKFADYDDCAESQKRYCFISDNGANFQDGKPTYKVTY